MQHISLFRYLLVSLFLLLLPYRSVGEEHPVLDRFTFSTNLIDWALVMPNLGVELDLGNPSRISTPSIALSLKASPASKDYLAEGLFNQDSYQLWSARLDYRYHFTFHRHPELYKSRFYAGLFAEYMDYTLHTPLDIHDRGALKDGKATIFGLTGGYDFPGFSYHNRQFVQFQAGANIGVIHTNYEAYTDQGHTPHSFTFPMLTELRLAMTFRTRSISRKYCLPNYERYRRIKAEDDLLQQQLDDLLLQMEADPVTLYVRPASGKDSLFEEPLTLPQLRRAFRAQYKTHFFFPERIQPLYNNTSFPITTPGEHYLVSYTIPVRAHDYDSEDTEREYYFPFRVRFMGYDQAFARQSSFNTALRNYYYNHDRHLPSMMVDAINRDEFIKSPSLDEILDLLNAQWPESELRREEVTGIYYRQDGEFQPVEEGKLLRRGTYALGLRFHTQVAESYDTLSTRFNLEPFVATDVKSRYESLLSVSTTKEFFVNRPWRNGHEAPVTVDDVLRSMADNGFYGYSHDNVSLEDSVHYGRNVGTASFGKVLPQLRFIYVVEDSTSLALGSQFQKALQRGLNPGRNTWKLDVTFNSTYGPICQGKWDENHHLVPADTTEVVRGIMRFLVRCNPQLAGQTIEPYQIESYTYTGVHEIPDGKPRNRWTLFRFAYRYVNADGHSRVAHANVTYRLQIPPRKL